MSTWAAIAVAGSLGAVSRYVTDFFISSRVRSSMPWGTTAVNLSGSFAAGFLAGLVSQSLVGDELRVVVGGGFLGSYTTFSTFTYETTRLFEHGDLARALLNIATVLAGIAAAAVGWSAARL